MIEHLIFDLDRTLYPLHTEMSDRISYLTKKFVADFWHVSLEEGSKMRHDGVVKYGTTLDWLMSAGGFKDVDGYFKTVHPDNECEGLPKAPALRPLLESLPQKKMILTNSPAEHAERVLKFLGVRDLFDSICDLRMNHMKGKPYASAFNTALRMCGGTIENTLFLDDAEGYTDGWVALGGTAVLVNEGGMKLHTPNLAGRTLVIKDIYELPSLLQTL